MEETPRKIHLVRHGESEWNKIRKVQGNADNVGLSERGRAQSRLLGQRLTAMRFDHVICSDIQRAVETAAIALEGESIEYDHELREIAFGEWEGRLVSDLKEEQPGEIENWFRSPSKVDIKGAERFLDFHLRVRTRMDQIIQATSGDLLIIAHGGVICAWLTHILGMDADDIWAFSLANTSVTTIMLEYRPRVRSLGDSSHLDEESLGFDGMPSTVK
jgi:broad specificity phosphatase PhoE